MSGWRRATDFPDRPPGHRRDGERRVIARLLNDGPQVLATGGGAFMDEDTRAAAKEKGISLVLELRAVRLQRVLANLAPCRQGIT